MLESFCYHFLKVALALLLSLLEDKRQLELGARENRREEKQKLESVQTVKCRQLNLEVIYFVIFFLGQEKYLAQ